MSSQSSEARLEAQRIAYFCRQRMAYRISLRERDGRCGRSVGSGTREVVMTLHHRVSVERSFDTASQTVRHPRPPYGVPHPLWMSARELGACSPLTSIEPYEGGQDNVNSFSTVSCSHWLSRIARKGNASACIERNSGNDCGRVIRHQRKFSPWDSSSNWLETTVIAKQRGESMFIKGKS